MSTHNIHLKYRKPKRYHTIISIMPPGVAPIITFRGSNNRCLEQIFMVPKSFEPSKFGCIIMVIACWPLIEPQFCSNDESFCLSMKRATKLLSFLLFGFCYVLENAASYACPILNNVERHSDVWQCHWCQNAQWLYPPEHFNVRATATGC